ncbi:MAG: J domain-containing protein [Chloroflexota bacterium]|nr:J domain-containing protein [Chloroflexota bacterium]
MAPTHYDVLNVKRNASKAAVRAAFRLRSHIFHPDKYENYDEPLRSQLMEEAGAEFKRLRRAYEVLSNTESRREYDRSLRSRATGTTKRSTRPQRAKSPASGTRSAAQSPPSDGGAAPHNGPTAGRQRADPLLVVSPSSLDFGLVSAGKRRQLALRISNAGGRTLFGEITSNRAWLTVNRHSFISSSTLVLVSVDTTHLQAGNDYWGNLVVSTLNGGDRVVRVSVGVAEPVQPVIAGVPTTVDFGTAAPGQVKTRTIRPRNAGSGRLNGSIAVSGRWLSASHRRFDGDEASFELIANAAGLPVGERYAGEVHIYSNGGTAAIATTMTVQAPAHAPTSDPLG